MNIRKIYDTFTFFNEFDLLELRLHTLNEVVDRFVLVEGDRTHANASKPLYFSTMRDSRFDRFIDKISVVTVTEWPAFETAWHYETFQRNSIMRGLTNCRPDDLIIISDVDEIPSPEAILAYQPGDGIMALKQYLYWFAFNNISLAKPYWMKARVLDYASLLHGLDGHKVNNIYNPIDDDNITTPSKVRMYRVPPPPHIKAYLQAAGISPT